MCPWISRLLPCGLGSKTRQSFKGEGKTYSLPFTLPHGLLLGPGVIKVEVEAGFEPAYAAVRAATWPLGHSTRCSKRA